MPDNHDETRINPITLDPSLTPSAVQGPRPSETEQDPPDIVKPDAAGDGPQEAMPGTPREPGEVDRVEGPDDGGDTSGQGQAQ